MLIYASSTLINETLIRLTQSVPHEYTIWNPKNAKMLQAVWPSQALLIWDHPETIFHNDWSGMIKSTFVLNILSSCWGSINWFWSCFYVVLTSHRKMLSVLLISGWSSSGEMIRLPPEHTKEKKSSFYSGIKYWGLFVIDKKVCL